MRAHADSVRALTLRQPWAWAVIFGGKNVENRTWKPRKPFTLLVHAGITWTEEGAEHCEKLGVDVPEDATWGGQIIGAVDVTGATEQSDSPWALPGYWHWELQNPRPANPPIPTRGRAALFRPPEGWEGSFSQRVGVS